MLLAAWYYSDGNVGKSADAASCPAAPPTGPADPFGSQSPGAASPERASAEAHPRRKSTAGPAAKKGNIGVQWGQKGPGPLSDRLAQQAWR
jgi:hypothetical protein